MQTDRQAGRGIDRLMDEPTIERIHTQTHTNIPTQTKTDRQTKGRMDSLANKT